jgi:hypothetical protein
MLQLPQPTTGKVTHSRKAAYAEINNDPIIARIAHHKQLSIELTDKWDEWDIAQIEAEKTLGRRPRGLIAWRNFSAIGGSELERCRDVFIELGNDPVVIKKEYTNAKRRERECLAAEKQWIENAGLSKLNAQIANIRRKRRAIERSFAKQPARTAAGAAAIINYLHEQFSEGDGPTELELGCLKATAEALASMSRVEAR